MIDPILTKYVSKLFNYSFLLTNILIFVFLWPLIVFAKFNESFHEVWYAFYFRTACITLASQWDAVRKDLLNLLSQSSECMGDKKLNILEIGAGTGANFKFYPKNARVSTIEINTKLSAEQSQELHKNQLEMGQSFVGNAENMQMIPSESFDAVVGTLLLCCVKETDRGLAEIYRVLKPGGKYYLMEYEAMHTKGLKRTWQRFNTFFHKFAALGCHAVQDIKKSVTGAGFRVGTFVPAIVDDVEVHYENLYYGVFNKE